MRARLRGGGRPAVALAVGFLAAVAAPPAAAAITVPAGFEETSVASVDRPTALTQLPDGRLLVAGKLGRLELVRADTGAVSPTPVLDLSARVCTESERGLLGVAVDPAFASTRAIYVFHTVPGPAGCALGADGAVNRLSRFTLTGDVADRASERVLLDRIPSTNGNHNAGDVQIGRDGLLYVTTGDGACDWQAVNLCGAANDAARDPHVLLGKVLRLRRDGSVPPENPYAQTGDRCAATGRTTAGRRCQETFASGLRNPFRLAFDGDDPGTRFFINDVGQSAWEEIDEGRAGADYGWNLREGPCATGSTTDCGPAPAGLTDPVHAYDHSGDCGAITAGAFVPSGAWPAAYDDDYLFTDYLCGTIFRLTPDGAGWRRTQFVSGLGTSSATAMHFAGNGDLFYASYGSGRVRRLRYTGSGNRTPSAALEATPRTGPVPRQVVLDARGSSDPDGDALTYLFTPGDGSPVQTTAQPAIAHTYSKAGTFYARLRVRDPHGATSPEVVRRLDVGNAPPQPSITAPAGDARFGVGDAVTLRGAATDPEDGALAASRLSWEVLLHHDDHVHPFRTGTGASLTFAWPAPEDLGAARTSFLEARLTARDSRGLGAVTIRNVRPVKVVLTFTTSPGSGTTVVGGLAQQAPARVISWRGWPLSVTAPAERTIDGRRYGFYAWSTGRPRSHTLTTPGADATYRATYVPFP